MLSDRKVRNRLNHSIWIVLIAHFCKFLLSESTINQRANVIFNLAN